MMAGLIVLIASCSSSKSEKAKKEVSVNGKSDVLVAYFSATGNTKKAAERVAEATGGTLYEITPIRPYTDEDLDYENEKSRSAMEKEDPAMRPEIKLGLDLTPYSTVYVGFPIWWYKAPNLIYTFLDSYNFEGKKIVVFATSGSSSLESSFNALVKAYPTYNFVEGSVDNAANKAKFNEWVESLSK